MSTLALLSSHFGIPLSASDRAHTPYVNMLNRRGIPVSVNCQTHLPIDAKLVVYSLAVDERDKVLCEAEMRGVPTVSRAEYLGAICSPYRLRIGVSGTHGKSTTVAMLHRIFEAGGLSPTTLSGAALSLEEDNIHIGSLNCIIFENCEYKDSFLLTAPDVGAFLNLEYDHTDYFKTPGALYESFAAAIEKCPKPILYADDENLWEIARNLHTPPILVGTREGVDYKIEHTCRGVRIYSPSGECAQICLPLIGRFNLLNAAMASAVARECGVPLCVSAKALQCFRGIRGRLEEIGSLQNRRVFLDYAHHPTEIKAGIDAIKNATGQPLTVIFGPHTYSRTASLFDDFVDALSYADHVMITEIDGVREEMIEGVSAEALASRTGGDVVRRASDIREKIKLTDGCIVIMGAINMEWVTRALFN